MTRLALALVLALAAPRPAAAKDSYAGIAASLARGDAPKTTSVLVLRGDSVEYEGYFEGATRETLHDTRSATKSLTSLAVGLAIARGALPGVSAPAFPYLSDLKQFANDGPL